MGKDNLTCDESVSHPAESLPKASQYANAQKLKRKYAPDKTLYSKSLSNPWTTPYFLPGTGLNWIFGLW